MGRPKGGKNRYYSKEEKLLIVHAVGAGHSTRQVATEYGIPSDSIVRKWVRQYRDGGEEALIGKRKPGNPLGGYANKKAPSEVEQFRHELALAHMEIARLKKEQEQEWRDARAKK